MEKTINISLAQFQPKLCAKSTNLSKIESLMDEAKKQGGDIVIFPELCLTGYHIEDRLSEMAEDLIGESVQHVRCLCEKFQIHSLFSFPELIDHKFYISAVLIDSNGKLLGVYRKTHLFGAEKKFFSRGNTFEVLDTLLGRIGVMICYDLEFPEVARILKILGADIIIVATANMEPYERHQNLFMECRSLENEIPIAICNRIGTEKDTVFVGNSSVFDAFGNCLRKLGKAEGVLTEKVVLGEGNDSDICYRDNRCPFLYQKILCK